MAGNIPINLVGAINGTPTYNATQEVVWYETSMRFGEPVLLIAVYALIIYYHYKTDNERYERYTTRKGKVINVRKLMLWAVRLYPLLVVISYGIQYVLALTIGEAYFRW